MEFFSGLERHLQHACFPHLVKRRRVHCQCQRTNRNTRKERKSEQSEENETSRKIEFPSKNRLMTSNSYEDAVVLIKPFGKS